MEPEFRIFRLADTPSTPMPGGRGSQKHLINTLCGAQTLDVHLNRLDVGEPGGRYHHHSRSDNVYIVKRGVGHLVVEGEVYEICEDDVVYIPACVRHSLTNKGDDVLELFEIYAPAGEQFDFVIDEPVDHPTGEESVR